ncbi:hypothetical protein OSTOST_16824 [Ostertagia ostertagi]
MPTCKKGRAGIVRDCGSGALSSYEQSYANPAVFVDRSQTVCCQYEGLLISQDRRSMNCCWDILVPMSYRRWALSTMKTTVDGDCR